MSTQDELENEVKSRAKEYVEQYVDENVPPQAAPAVAAAKVLLNGGSMEDAANAAMQTACVAATSGVATLACSYLTVDNLIAAGDALYEFLPDSWKAKGKMQCWFYDYKVVYAARETYSSVSNLMGQTYNSLRESMGLPNKEIYIYTKQGNVIFPEFDQVVNQHPDWHKKAWAPYYPYGTKNANIQKDLYIDNTEGQGPWYWESSSPDDCNEAGLKSFNDSLAGLYERVRFKAVEESIPIFIQNISGIIKNEIKSYPKTGPINIPIHSFMMTSLEYSSIISKKEIKKPNYVMWSLGGITLAIGVGTGIYFWKMNK